MARRHRSHCTALLACALVEIACKRHREAVPALTPMAVPFTHGAIKIDGEWDEPEWDQLAARAVFTERGAPSRPFSEIRLLHDATNIYVVLYAGDEDIRSTDVFELAIGSVAFRVDPRGRVTPATPGVIAAADIDEGTIDNPADADEEWVIELAIPITTVGLDQAGVASARARRCDTPKAGPSSCGVWDGSISLAHD